MPTLRPCRYDALLLADETHALSPLHGPPHGWGEDESAERERREHEVPETFPTGT